METLKIILLAILAGVTYGIIHDQITARICIEYFTIFHPRVIASESPTLLGLVWGVLATWWAGTFLGGLLAVAARVGSRPALAATKLMLSIAKLLAIMALSASVAGCAGYVLTRNRVLSTPGWVRLAPSRQAVFMADWYAHMASYASALLGGLVLCVIIYRRRLRISMEPA